MNGFRFIPSVLLFLGCATSRQPEVVRGAPRSTTNVSGMDGVSAIDQDRSTEIAVTAFNASAPRLWSVLPDVYESLGIPATTVDSRALVMGNLNLTVRRRLGGKPLSLYLSCGMNAFGADNADSYTVTLEVVTQVVPQDTSHAETRTRVQARARREAMSEHPVRCASTGALERRAAEQVLAALSH